MNSLKLEIDSPLDNPLLERVGALIRRVLELPDDIPLLDLEARLADLGVSLDSFDILRLIAALEEGFGIVLEETDLTVSAFESIGSIVSLVRDKLEVKA
jgi:acyl carrier protein